MEFIPFGSRIWCPFDTEDSWYVRAFKEKHQVVYSHKDNGSDFFNQKVWDNMGDVDYIISNPPYSLKTEVFEKLFASGKKFAMLVGVVGLFESQKRFDLFSKNDFEILYFNRRVSFFQDFLEQVPKLNPPFSSVYITHGVLPKQIMFKEINKAV